MKDDETCRETEDEGQMKPHNPWQKSVAFAHDGEPSSSQRPRNAAMNSMGARMPMSFTPMQADLDVSCGCIAKMSMGLWLSQDSTNPNATENDDILWFSTWTLAFWGISPLANLKSFTVPLSVFGPQDAGRWPDQVQNMQTSADEPGQFPGVMAWSPNWSKGHHWNSWENARLENWSRPPRFHPSIQFKMTIQCSPELDPCWPHGNVRCRRPSQTMAGDEGTSSSGDVALDQWSWERSCRSLPRWDATFISSALVLQQQQSGF